MLDLRTDLPKIRKAFDAGQLKQKGLYSGPCAVGICLPEPIRKELDFHYCYSGIWVLEGRGAVEVAEGQLKDWEELQEAFDNGKFSVTLAEMEAKYAS
jgi:hypothetical protein